MIKKHSYLKPPKTYKGRMNALRQLLADNTSYPPSEQIWRQIIGIIAEETPTHALESIQDKIRQETDRYKPALPEPLLSRFYHQGNYYYLDARNNLYQHDPGNALVGNLVGHIEKSEDPETNEVVIKVIVKKKEVLEIPILNNVAEQEMHHKTYYVDDRKKVYRGFHPQENYLYSIGTLNSENKINLFHKF